MNYEKDNNRAELSGVISREITYDSRRKLYKTAMDVRRTSGVVDTVPLTITYKNGENFLPKIGDKVAVRGTVRTYNEVGADGVGHVNLHVHVSEILKTTNDSKDKNEVLITGSLCKLPKYRKTPMGKEITDLIVANNSKKSGKSSYIPCITWGSTARQCADMKMGDSVVIRGRFQSRKYNKLMEDSTVVEKTAYEISIFSLEMF